MVSHLLPSNFDVQVKLYLIASSIWFARFNNVPARSPARQWLFFIYYIFYNIIQFYVLYL